MISKRCVIWQISILKLILALLFIIYQKKISETRLLIDSRSRKNAHFHSQTEFLSSVMVFVSIVRSQLQVDTMLKPKTVAMKL